MRNGSQLADTLARIDGRGYRAYRDIIGAYALGDDVTLHVDRVQGDPFAAPSKLRVRIAMSTARIPKALCAARARESAVRDALAR